MSKALLQIINNILDFSKIEATAAIRSFENSLTSVSENRDDG
jgi:signal transduction histidine kinase